MPDRIFQTKAKVIKNIEVTNNYYRIVLLCPQVASAARPGQFLQVKVNNSNEPLLRRPFGVHRVSALHVEMLYEALGQGTRILAQRKAGEYLDVIGPLGNGFDYRTAYGVRRTAILVAGGMGVAPLVYLAEQLLSHQDTMSVRKPPRRGPSHQVVVLVGARTKKQLLCEDEFKRLGCQVRVATDDGSKGFKGRVTDLLKKFLHDTRYSVLGTIYACGPRPMLNEISRLAKNNNLPAEVSLEEHMACGIGACLGCVVNTIDGYKRVCKEGPVFQAKEIIF